MKVRKVINRRFRRSGNGINVAGGITGVVAANVGEKGSSTVTVSNRQRIVQGPGPDPDQPSTTSEENR